MTPVERGEDWGRKEFVSEEAQMASSDAGLVDVLTGSSATNGNPGIPIVVTGGDVCRTLGGRGDAQPGQEATLAEVDVGQVLVDGRLHRFVAHVVAGSLRRPTRWWVAASAAHWRSYNFAPRAHPGDGLLDIVDAHLKLSDLPKVWRRLQPGLHVPHPRIMTERTQSTSVSFSTAVPVRIDGRPPIVGRNLVVRINPDERIWIAV